MGLNFLTQMVLARVLGATGFGSYSYAANLAQIGSVAADLGTSSSVSRFVPEYIATRRTGAALGIIRFASFLPLALGVPIAAVIFAWSAAADAGPTDSATMAVGLAALPLISLALVQLNILRSLGLVLLALAPTFLLQPMIFMALVVLLPDVTPQTALALFLLAIGLAVALQATLVAAARRRRLTHASRAEYPIRAWLRVSSPMLAVGILQMILTRADVIFVGLFLGARSAGIYALVTRLGSIISIMANSYGTILAPRLAALHWAGDTEAGSALVRSAMRVTAPVGTVIALLLVVAGREVLSSFGGEFEEGYVSLVVYSVGLAAKVALGPVGYVALMIGRERAMLVLNAASVAIATVGFVLLIPSVGMLGAALADVCGLFLTSLGALSIIRRNGYARVTLRQALMERWPPTSSRNGI